MKILITCPPMIKQISRYHDILIEKNFQYYCPNVKQIMSEEELINLLPNYDGWIIGDDPATRKVFEAGKNGQLKAAVKWGVGVDNVDFEACKDLNIPIINTPGMFGNEVADIAIGYLLGLSRDLFYIDREVRKGNWIKPTGVSLSGKKVCLVGFGDIGRNIAKRLIPFEFDIYVSDPGFYKNNDEKIICQYDNSLIIPDQLNIVKIEQLDNCLKDADFIIVSCSLNKHTHNLLNKDNIVFTKKGVRIINISRGGIINENDAYELQKNNHIYGLALDVFEKEPFPLDNKLREFETNIFGTHNGSNTLEAVDKTSLKAINIINDFLGNK